MSEESTEVESVEVPEVETVESQSTTETEEVVSESPPVKANKPKKPKKPKKTDEPKAETQVEEKSVVKKEKKPKEKVKKSAPKKEKKIEKKLEKTKKPDKAKKSEKKKKGGLRTAQVRILKLLSKKDLLPRNIIAEKAPVDVANCVELIGSHDPDKRAANDVKHFPSLITLGLVRAEQHDVKGRDTILYRITPKGKSEVAKL